ncbi:ABC transporter substrate-binding protein [Streptomyces sp. NPDC127068]|uniref:ABC transporter substrate-binding protein n=1 Tax=Streptomyces sp. NPDC127068 TaxID=3347127 RepID=UPI0036461BA7
MRSVRLRVLASTAALITAGAGAWSLLPEREETAGSVTVGTSDQVISLDPAGAHDAGSWALHGNLFQSLLTFRPGEVEPVPDAASRCDFIGPELRTYQCELRPGLTFPSGRTVTGADVKHSIDRVRTIRAKVGPAALFAGLDAVEANGRTVTFRLARPDATFPYRIATAAGSIVDSTRYPADALRTGDRADGSGHYTLTSYRPGSAAKLSPNVRYRGAVPAGGRPVVLRYYADPEALDAAWRGRQIDVAARQLPPAALAALRPSATDHRLSEAASAETRNLVLNVRPGSGLADRQVRRAVAAVLDREALAAVTYRGTVTPLYSLIPRGIHGHTTSFFDEYPEVDVRRARKLLRDAGVEVPLAFHYGHARGSSAADEAAEVKRQLEATGLFRMRITAYEWGEFRRTYAEGRLDAYAVSWVPDYPDPDTYTAQLVGSGAIVRNGYAEPEAQRLVRDAQRFEDRAGAAGALRALQTVVARDVPVIPLWQRKEYVLTRAGITGGQYLTDGTGLLRLWTLARV